MKKLLSCFLSAIISISSFFYVAPVYADKQNNSTTKGFWSEDNNPEFYGTTKIVIKKGENFSLDNTIYRIFARDFEDFNISNKIKSTHNVDTSIPGEYKINYSVTDSHGNTSTLEVPVIVTEDENVKNMIERTMYSLPSVDNIAAMEIHRGNNHDRQMLGIFVKANSNLRIRKVSGGSDLTYTMLNNDSHTESTATITNEWKNITFEYDYTPFIKTLYKQNTPVKVEIEWDSNDTGVKELNYYHEGDNESKFFEKWNNDVDSYSVIEGEALTVLVPYSDRNLITNHWAKGFKTIDEFLNYWKNVVDNYDDMLGLEYAPDNPKDQNVKTKFFVKANAHGAGAAYYAGDHVGVNKSSVASFFEVNWGGLHEFGHGYQGSLGKGDLNIGEVSNNIFGHYVQINKDIYPYEGDWLGKLSNIEEKYNKVRLDGGTFLDLDVSGKLYFIINFLNAFEGPDTYKEIARLYRHNVIEGNNMSTQDAWILGIYKAYGMNLIDYFEAWGIDVSESIKLKIENSNAKNIFSMKDLVNDEALINTIKADLNVDTNYALVTNEQLSKYNLSGNLNINITIDNEELIKGKYVILKDGNKEVYKQKIDSSKITIKDLPVGVYKLFLPEFTGSYINNISNVIISNNKTTEKDITYTNIENKNYLDNDVKVQFQGYYYNDAAEIKLLNDNTTNTLSANENLKLHFRYRGTTLFNSGLPADYEYAKIQVLNNNDDEVYLKKVGGKGEMFSTVNVETEEIPVEIGYKLVLKYHNAKDKLKFISKLNNDYRTVYQIDNNTEATFIVTEDGLRPYNMSDEDFYNEYIGRLEQYIEKFVNNVTEEEIYTKSVYKSEKNIIIRGYKKMNEKDKLKYKDLYDAIVNGAKPQITIQNKNIEIYINDEINLYDLVKVNDFEDGELGDANIEVVTDLDTNKLGNYEVRYIVTDSDNNVSSDSLFIEVIPHNYDTSALEQIIEEAKKVSNNDYTEQSYLSLQEELKRAQDILLRENLTQDIINEQINKLQEAINNLQLLKKYTIIFETNGGNEIPQISDVIENSKISKPKDPIKDEFVFGGWYKDESYNEIWDFEKDVVDNDITLYAKWIELNSPEIPNTDSGSTDGAESPEVPDTDDGSTDGAESPEVPDTDDGSTDGAESPEVPDTDDGSTDGAESPEIPDTDDGSTDRTNDINIPKAGDTSIGFYLLVAVASSVCLFRSRKSEN